MMTNKEIHREFLHLERKLQLILDENKHLKTSVEQLKEENKRLKLLSEHKKNISLKTGNQIKMSNIAETMAERVGGKENLKRIVNDYIFKIEKYIDHLKQ